MDERRLLIAVALSLLVLAGYQMLFPPAPPSARPTPAPPTASAPAASPIPPVATPTPPASARKRPGAAASAAPIARVVDERERRVEVTGPDLVVAFSNRGARLLSWQLLGFRDARGRPE